MSPTTFFLLLLSCSVYCLSSTAHTRRILHQPFQSLRSDPPVSAPPASPVYGDAPFFPSNRLLPPPSPLSPKALASFPANISSIIVPRAQETNPVSSKLIGTAIASASATVIVITIGVVLLFRKKMNRSVSGEWKSHRSDSSARLSYCNSIGGGRNPLVPKLQRPCQPSSELLYLGTVANLHGASAPRNLQTTPSSISTRNVRPLKPGSPELRSLAPLHRQSFELHYEIGSEADEETDVFYSPKGSLGDRESSVGTGSASRRAFSAVEVEIFEQSSSSSSSPKMPACLRIPPPESCSRLRSPESLPIQTALSPLQSPPQHPPPVFVAHWTYTRESDSPSPASSSSPERDSRRSIDSSPGTSCTWDRSIKSPLRICNSVESPPQLDSHFRLDIQGIESPERISFSRTESHARTSTSLPQSGHSLPISAAPSPFPPGPSFCTPALTRPPPPPSIKMWESPHTPSMDESPELVNSFRQIKIESPTLSSPVQLPLKPESGESNAQMVGLCSTESSEKNEDKTKPMLKPLHWDKVLASSHGEIVCDHLQSNSFKYDILELGG
ncbi:unnamed protein product [Cuscuta epithymum]|uniref:Uncharacterized protein n=1 Tax=Cuscuta epithymum TaxID=186058 RepID=A0AAV0CG55_9ASTE|nr:unnamed protein product [Cuscuta epithymum]